MSETIFAECEGLLIFPAVWEETVNRKCYENRREVKLEKKHSKMHSYTPLEVARSKKYRGCVKWQIGLGAGSRKPGLLADRRQK